MDIKKLITLSVASASLFSGIGISTAVNSNPVFASTTKYLKTSQYAFGPVDRDDVEDKDNNIPETQATDTLSGRGELDLVYQMEGDLFITNKNYQPIKETKKGVGYYSNSLDGRVTPVNGQKVDPNNLAYGKYDVTLPGINIKGIRPASHKRNLKIVVGSYVDMGYGNNRKVNIKNVYGEVADLHLPARKTTRKNLTIKCRIELTPQGYRVISYTNVK